LEKIINKRTMTGEQYKEMMKVLKEILTELKKIKLKK